MVVATHFADTSFCIAFSSRRDQHYAQAIALHAAVTKSGSRIVTTEAVLREWLNALANTPTRAIAAEAYRRTHADSLAEVVLFESALNGAAAELYRSRDDKDWSLTDCLSFVMESGPRGKALTTDHPFEHVGTKALMLSLPSR